MRFTPQQVLCGLAFILYILVQGSLPSLAQEGTEISSLEVEIRQLEAKIVRLEREGASALELRGTRLRLDEKRRLLAEKRELLSEDLQFRRMYLGNAQAADASAVIDAAARVLRPRDQSLTGLDIALYTVGALVRVRGYILLEHTWGGDRVVIVRDNHPAQDPCWAATDSNCYQPITCLDRVNIFPVFTIWKAQAISQRDWADLIDLLYKNGTRCVRSKLRKSIYPDGSAMRDLHVVVVEGVLNTDRIDHEFELEDWVLIRE